MFYRQSAHRRQLAKLARETTAPIILADSGMPITVTLATTDATIAAKALLNYMKARAMPIEAGQTMLRVMRQLSAITAMARVSLATTVEFDLGKADAIGVGYSLQAIAKQYTAPLIADVLARVGGQLVAAAKAAP